MTGTELAKRQAANSCLILLKVCTPAVDNVRVKTRGIGASLVAQWLGVCLLMQGTRVRALVWEDPACRGAAGPVSHSC